MSKRKAMIDRTQSLSVVRQCRLLAMARSTVYHQDNQEAKPSLEVLRVLNVGQLKYPFYGFRQLRDWRETQEHTVTRKRVQRLVSLMGLSAIYPRKKTSPPGVRHRVSPYALKNMTITQPNHVWATDISYIPMTKGFLDLVALMDWASRRVLTWRLSNILDSYFWVEALEEALAQ